MKSGLYEKETEIELVYCISLEQQQTVVKASVYTGTESIVEQSSSSIEMVSFKVSSK